MNRRTFFEGAGSSWLWVVVMIASAAACAALPIRGGERAQPRDFSYAGGTEALSTGCAGALELSPVSMTFTCPEGSVTIPYSAITLMQYRPKLSTRVRKMKLDWKARPEGTSAKKNLLFTVLYRQGSSTQAMVLKVQPDNMRPYLAEIELNTRKRIEVWDYRGFD